MKLKQSLANPHGKMIHLHGVGKSIFITFIQPAPHFYSLTERLLFPLWCWIDQMSQESELLFGLFPAGLIQQPRGEGDCSAWHGWVQSKVKVRSHRGCTLALRNSARGTCHFHSPAFCVRCVEGDWVTIILLAWKNLPSVGRRGKNPVPSVWLDFWLLSKAWKGCQYIWSNNRAETLFYSFPCFRLGLYLCRSRLLHIPTGSC